jgi:hypothetical protein
VSDSWSLYEEEEGDPRSAKICSTYSIRGANILLLLGAETSHKIKDKMRTQHTSHRAERDERGGESTIQGTVEGHEHLSASTGGVIVERDNLKLPLGVRGHTPTISKRATSSPLPLPHPIPPRVSLPE